MVTLRLSRAILERSGLRSEHTLRQMLSRQTVPAAKLRAGLRRGKQRFDAIDARHIPLGGTSTLIQDCPEC